jgi:hypothetical protein
MNSTQVHNPGVSYLAREFVPKGANTCYPRRLSLTAPLALSAAGCHALINSAALITTGITQPDFARNVSIVSGGSGHAAAGVVTINGLDIRKNVISEALTLNGNTKVVGVKAFASVTSIDMTAVTGNDVNNTVSVGYDNKFGLDRLCDSDGVIKATTDTATDTLPTVHISASDISQNTVVPATAPNAAHNYVFTFFTTEARTGK